MIHIFSDIAYPDKVFVSGDPHSQRMIRNHLNKIPEYMFLPNYSGIPVPVIFMFDWWKTNTTKNISVAGIGLWREIELFCKDSNIEYDINIDPEIKYTKFRQDYESFREMVLGWRLSLVPHEYQIRAAWLILHYKFSLSELATRSGKTLIMYIVLRASKLLLGIRKVLIIVPSVQLVRQGVIDLNEYGPFFNTEIQEIWANPGKKYTDTAFGSGITIGTFQSLVLRANPGSERYEPNFFRDYDAVVIDEAHKTPCKSIKSILESLDQKNLKIRFGFSGSLPKKNTIEWYECQLLAGPQIQTIRASTLVGEGILAMPIIYQVPFRYDIRKNEDLGRDLIECGEYLLGIPELDPHTHKKILLPENRRKFTLIYEKTLPITLRELKKNNISDQEYVSVILKLLKKSSKLFELEQMLVQCSDTRLELIRQLIVSEKIPDSGNGIIFVHHIMYGNVLLQYLTEKLPNKKIVRINGTIGLKRRTSILQEMETNNNMILIGSYGCVSTGLTFKNVSWGIFAQAFKSEIINKQALGRLMLRKQNKSNFVLFDLVDIFPESKKLYRHGMIRKKIYESEGWCVHDLSK